MKYTLIVLSLLCALSGFSQVTAERSADWKLLDETSEVSLYSKYVDCNYPNEGVYAEYVLLKLVNKTTNPVQVKWNNDIYYNQIGCVNCNHKKAEPANSIILPAGTQQEGSCDLAVPNVGLRVFSKWLQSDNDRHLIKLVISDLQTIPQEQ